MNFITLDANGEYDLTITNSNIINNDRTTVVIVSNPDTATIVFGYKDSSGNFKAYAEGTIDTDAVINHGRGVKLMVKITDFGTEDIVIGYSA